MLGKVFHRRIGYFKHLCFTSIALFHKLIWSFWAKNSEINRKNFDLLKSSTIYFPAYKTKFDDNEQLTNLHKWPLETVDCLGMVDLVKTKELNQDINHD